MQQYLGGGYLGNYGGLYYTEADAVAVNVIGTELEIETGDVTVPEPAIAPIRRRHHKVTEKRIPVTIQVVGTSLEIQIGQIAVTGGSRVSIESIDLDLTVGTVRVSGNSVVAISGSIIEIATGSVIVQGQSILTVDSALLEVVVGQVQVDAVISKRVSRKTEEEELLFLLNAA